MARKRQFTLYVKLTQDEKEKISKDAFKEGMTVSDYVRYVLLKGDVVSE